MKSHSSPIVKTLGWVWIAFAALNLADLAWRGQSAFAVLAAAVLVLTIALVVVFALRPKVVAAEEGVRVLNPLRVTTIPWPAVTDVDVTDVLRVHTGERVVRAWAMRENKRARVRANLRRKDTGGGDASEDPSPVDHAARQLRDEAHRRARSGGAEAVGEPKTRWSPAAIGVLGAALAALIAVVLFL